MNILKTPDPILVNSLFPEIHEELIKLLKSLSEAEWGAQTACAGWSVKDVALHLLGVDLGNLSRRRDGFSDSRHIDGWDELVHQVNRMNQNWVETSRFFSTNLLIHLSETIGAQMCAFFASLDPFAEGSPVSWIGPDPFPLWMDLAREYTERWHHQQHIRDAVKKPGLKQPKYFAPVIDTFIRALPRTYQDKAAKDGVSVSVRIGGQSGGNWTIIREKPVWRLYRGMPASPNSIIDIHEDDAWRLFTRGLSEKEARERVRITGQRELGQVIYSVTSIIA